MVVETFQTVCSLFHDLDLLSRNGEASEEVFVDLLLGHVHW